MNYQLIRQKIRGELLQAQGQVREYKWLDDRLKLTRLRANAYPQIFMQVLFSMASDLMRNPMIPGIRCSFLVAYLDELEMLPRMYRQRNDLFREHVLIDELWESFQANPFYNRAIPSRSSTERSYVFFPLSYRGYFPENLQEFCNRAPGQMSRTLMLTLHRLLYQTVQLYRNEIQMVEGRATPPVVLNWERAFLTRLAFELTIGTVFRDHLYRAVFQFPHLARISTQIGEDIRRFVNLVTGNEANLVNDIIWTLMPAGRRDYENLTGRMTEYLQILRVWPMRWRRPAPLQERSIPSNILLFRNRLVYEQERQELPTLGAVQAQEWTRFLQLTAIIAPIQQMTFSGLFQFVADDLLNYALKRGEELDSSLMEHNLDRNRIIWLIVVGGIVAEILEARLEM